MPQGTGGTPVDPGTITVNAQLQRRVEQNRQDLNESSAWWGGWFNPGNWYRGLYTGDASATDSDYQAALGAGGESYAENAEAAHDGLDKLAYVDPTPLSDGLNGALHGLEGNTDKAKEKLRDAAIGPLSDVARAGRALQKLRGVTGEVAEEVTEQATKKLDDGIKKTEDFAKPAKTDVDVSDPVTNRMRIENKAQQARDTAPTRGLGGRTLNPAQRAELNTFSDRARAAGYVENPHRTGSFGEIVDGKFKERVRIDIGDPSLPGWRGKTHLNFPGDRGHYPPNTPLP